MKRTACLLGVSALLLAGRLLGGEAVLKSARFTSLMGGCCFAGSKINDSKALGGFGPSTNFPQRVRDPRLLARKEVYLLANPSRIVPFAGTYQGIELLLVNGTGKLTSFKASDSRLPIIQEASIDGGPWRPLEFIPGSFCGNSFHRVFLGPKESWSFAAPKYEGETKARLRFRFEYEPGNIYYSNEFEGSVNLAQFHHNQPDRPLGPPAPYVPSPYE